MVTLKTSDATNLNKILNFYYILFLNKKPAPAVLLAM